LANRSSKIQFNIVEYILQEIGQPAIPLLATVAVDEGRSSGVRRTAMEALEQIDTVNALVAKALLKSLADKKPKVRQDISAALRHLDEK